VVTPETAQATMALWQSRLERDIGEARKMTLKLKGLECADQLIDNLNKTSKEPSQTLSLVKMVVLCFLLVRVGLPCTHCWRKELEVILEQFLALSRAGNLSGKGVMTYDVHHLNTLVQDGGPKVIAYQKYSKLGQGMLRSVEPKKTKGKKGSKDEDTDEEEA